MNKNPIINALAASAYIVLVVFIMNAFVDSPDKEGNIIIPIAVLSLFTLSAAVMGYLFLYQPIILFLENKNKKQEAIGFFLKTVGVFACITTVVLLMVLSR